MRVQTGWGAPTSGLSENCLFLNVQTPLKALMAGDKALPVTLPLLPPPSHPRTREHTHTHHPHWPHTLAHTLCWLPALVLHQQHVESFRAGDVSDASLSRSFSGSTEAAT